LKNGGISIDIFFSYAHEDEALMDEVRRQLILFDRQSLIRKWHDRMIPPGASWQGQIDERLRIAKVILLFVSPDFFASDYCYEQEMAEAPGGALPVVERTNECRHHEGSAIARRVAGDFRECAPRKASAKQLVYGGNAGSKSLVKFWLTDPDRKIEAICEVCGEKRDVRHLFA
jgi:hypothetical protein